MYDLLLLNGRVVDGTGNPWFKADLALEGDRIQALGNLKAASAKRRIDLVGRVIAPGFIDLHTHSDFTLPLAPRAEAMVRQGVTTQLVGNCGFSPFPVAPDKLDLLRSYAAFLDGGLSWDWQDAAGYSAYLGSLPLASNVALQVGHGTIRLAVMGFDNRTPTNQELERMQALVAQALEQGVLALSSGLIYVPGSYSKTEELVALAKVAARYGAFYSSHIRGEGATLLEAVEEALTIGREAGLPVQLSHHKASGRANWGKVNLSLDKLEQVRTQGQDVLADQYPYTAGSTTLAAILPAWVMEEGVSGMVARLSDPAIRHRIIEELTGPDASGFDLSQIMISAIPAGPNQPYEGMMLPQIAALRGETALDTALYLLENEGGGIQMISFMMSEQDVRRVMQHPAVAVASDGWTLNPASGGKPHPRSYGTFVEVLGKYVRQEKVLRLEEAVRKMTSLPAQRLGRYDLGLIRPGCRADLVVFNPEEVASRATFQNPHQYAVGVDYVIVNGQLVIEAGQDTGAKAGRVLRRTQP
jgi:N-acyl-D-amino-acid deacylase